MRFLANENFPSASVHQIRAAGHDIAAIAEDSPGAKDSMVLSRAAQEERIVLTFDRDYGELIFRHKSLSPLGVIYFRFDPLTPEEPAQFLLQLLSQNQVGVERKFTVVERGQIRQHPLP